MDIIKGAGVKSFALQVGKSYVMRYWKDESLAIATFLGAGSGDKLFDTVPSVKTMAPTESFRFDVNGEMVHAFNVGGALCIASDIKQRITFYMIGGSEGEYSKPVLVKEPKVKEVKLKEVKVREKAPREERKPREDADRFLAPAGSLKIKERKPNIQYFSATFAEDNAAKLDILVKKFNAVVNPFPITLVAFIKQDDVNAENFKNEVAKLGGKIGCYGALKEIKEVK